MHADDIKPLADAIYRDKVLRARQMPAEEKILAGESLFRAACAFTAAGIRQDRPGCDEEQVLSEIRRRLRLRERLERSHA